MSSLSLKKNLQNPAILGLLISLVLAIGAYVVYWNFYTQDDITLIDNPSNKEIKITINRNTYAIPPNQKIELKLEPGATVDLYSENDTDTTFILESTQALINPTRSVYVIYNRLYGFAENKDSLLKSQSFSIDQKVYFGKGKLDSSTVIQGFDYNLHQTLPKVVKRREDSLRTYQKVFSKKEFKQFYFEHYE